MKKLFLVLAIAGGMSVALSSCSNKPKCWEMTYELNGKKISGVYYWGTAKDADAAAEKQKVVLGGNTVTVTKKSVSKTQSECIGAFLK